MIIAQWIVSKVEENHQDQTNSQEKNKNAEKEGPKAGTDRQTVSEKCLRIRAAHTVIQPMLNTKTKKSCEFVHLDDVSDLWKEKKVNQRSQR